MGFTENDWARFAIRISPRVLQIKQICADNLPAAAASVKSAGKFTFAISPVAFRNAP
jgi:hypothetical protein